MDSVASEMVAVEHRGLNPRKSLVGFEGSLRNGRMVWKRVKVVRLGFRERVMRALPVAPAIIGEL